MLERLLLPLIAGVLPLAFPDPATEQAPTPPKVIELTITPKPSPLQPLRYRLLPLESQLTPGNAVPIYLRIGAETKDEAIDLISKETIKLLQGTIEDFPVDEGHKLTDQFARRLKQMDFAARRQTAEWNYTLPEEREDVINLLLPDVQELRTWSRLLPVKARLEIAEHRYPDAVRTIETGIAMGRHIAEGPFVINALVGIAVANQSLNQVEDLIGRPDAPNLYWSLTALPRPLVTVRTGMETEQALVENMIPELVEPEGPLTGAEWASRLARIHGRWNQIAKMLDVEATSVLPPNTSLPAAPPAKPTILVPDDPAKFVADVLPEAKSFMTKRDVAIDKMTDAEVIVRYLMDLHREFRDQDFTPTYLPYAEALPMYDAVEARRKERKGVVSGFLNAFQPAVQTAHTSEARLDRRVASFRIIEALRMHLAANGGSLPKSLDEVKIVPIPRDPMTGKPFEYQVDGEAALLTSQATPALSYRIRVAN